MDGPQLVPMSYSRSHGWSIFRRRTAEPKQKAPWTRRSGDGIFGRLIAWTRGWRTDSALVSVEEQIAVKQKKKKKKKKKKSGGVRFTSGNLVFSGQGTGELRGGPTMLDYGKKLWSLQTKSAIDSIR